MEEGPGRLRLRGWEERELCVRYSKCGVPQRGVMAWRRVKAGITRSEVLRGG